MKSVLIIMIACSFYCAGYAQEHPFCSSPDLKDKRIDILDQTLDSLPFNGIVQLGININSALKGHSTGAFIADNAIITAQHTFTEFKEIKDILVIYNTSVGNNTIKLTHHDFEVIPYTTNALDVWNDIAIVRITNTEKIKEIKRTNFKLVAFEETRKKITGDIHFTGYPFDKWDINAKKKIPVDTLSDKSANIKDAAFNSDSTMIGIKVCSCNGDSGGPLWAISGGDALLLGIGHGWANYIMDEELSKRNNYFIDYHFSVLINRSKLDWINKVLANETPPPVIGTPHLSSKEIKQLIKKSEKEREKPKQYEHL